MTVRFIKDTPHTARPGSTKLFKQGFDYVLSNEYAQELIAKGACVEVQPVTLQDLTETKATKKTKKS